MAIFTLFWQTFCKKNIVKVIELPFFLAELSLSCVFNPKTTQFYIIWGFEMKKKAFKNFSSEILFSVESPNIKSNNICFY
jgi:hypothetical protein